MTAPHADIALLLEGTYPYIRGGVSSWVHTLINGLPDLTFSLVFVGGSRDHYGEMQYELPSNVVHLEEHYLVDQKAVGVRQGTKRSREKRALDKQFQDLAKLHDKLREGDADPRRDHMKELVGALIGEDGLDREAFLSSELAWTQICESYLKFSTEPSFVDYFWTVRTIHEPLFVLSGIARNAPPAGLYHSISTGYAGYLGMMIHSQTGRPFVLTEHGIYTKERKIDLAQADWIQESVDPLDRTLGRPTNYIRHLWIRFFESLGRLTYGAANPITSLYEGNRERQIDDGADPERTLVIPNGIDLPRFAPLRQKRPEKIPPVLGLIGRVVPIKDIKTFIRAMRTVVTHMPEAEGWIIGPEDEDADYAKECHDLTASLGLTENVRFLGFQNVAEFLPQLGLMVLTSISEALPLVVLEGYASGLPCVTTDVGSCRELVEGGSEADQAIGHSGGVVPIADPQALAWKALGFLQDEERWKQIQEAGIRRVEEFYTLDMMLDTYRSVYEQALVGA